MPFSFRTAQFFVRHEPVVMVSCLKVTRDAGPQVTTLRKWKPAPFGQNRSNEPVGAFGLAMGLALFVVVFFGAFFTTHRRRGSWGRRGTSPPKRDQHPFKVGNFPLFCGGWPQTVQQVSGGLREKEDSDVVSRLTMDFFFHR